MANDKKFLDTDHSISLDMAVRVLNGEITWCYKHPMAERVSKDFREGFIAGIEQSKYLIIKMAEEIAKSSEKFP